MISDRPQQHWPEVRHGWRPLHGDFERQGLSVEWHDFRAEQPLDWGETFRPQSIEFCLNMSGRGAVGAGVQSDYVSGSAGYYALADEPLPATRRANERHQFVTLEFSRKHLQKQLAEHEGDLDADVRRAVFPEKKSNVVSVPRTMTAEQRNVVGTLLQPPVPKAAQALWYQSKAIELMEI